MTDSGDHGEAMHEECPADSTNYDVVENDAEVVDSGVASSLATSSAASSDNQSSGSATPTTEASGNNSGPTIEAALASVRADAHGSNNNHCATVEVESSSAAEHEPLHVHGHVHVAPLTEANLTLYSSVLQDIQSGQLSAQLPGAAARDGRAQMAQELRARAAELQLPQHQSLAATGSGLAAAGAEMRGLVDSYCRLIDWLQPWETLDKAFVDIDYRMQNGSVCKIACKAADTVKDLQEAINARLGACTGGPRQLLCNGEPMTDQTQGLYRFVSRRGQGMRRNGALTVQEVVRAKSG